MSKKPPSAGPGRPTGDDPFRKPSTTGDPQGGAAFSTTPPSGGGGNPYGSPPPSGGGPYGGGGGNPYGGPPPSGGDPYGGGGGGPYGGDPLAGMPPLADIGKRFLARLIDMILVGIVVGLLSLLFGVAAYDMDPDQVQYGRSFGQSLIAAVLYVAYDTILTARTGQTLGKRLMKLRVANLDNGSTPSMQTSLIRAAVLWIPFAFCCACVWTLICGGWAIVDKPYKQGLHDKAAKTVVVSTD